jgi:hypothetical protein
MVQAVTSSRVSVFVPSAFTEPTVRVQFDDGRLWPQAMTPAGAEAFVRRWNSLSCGDEPRASVLRDAHT